MLLVKHWSEIINLPEELASDLKYVCTSGYEMGRMEFNTIWISKNGKSVTFTQSEQIKYTIYYTKTALRDFVFNIEISGGRLISDLIATDLKYLGNGFFEKSYNYL